MAKQLGHHVTRLVPVLTAIDVKEDNRDLAGIRVKACVSLCHRGEIIAEETGELQFTKTEFPASVCLTYPVFSCFRRGRR